MACRVTHVLLPASLGVPRRADAIEVIGTALLAKAAGAGHRRIGAALGVPAGTVRGWIRAGTASAAVIRARATALAVELDPLLGPSEPTATALGDALQALGAAIAAAIRRLGPIAPPWQLAATITGGLLGPAGLRGS